MTAEQAMLDKREMNGSPKGRIAWKYDDDDDNNNNNINNNDYDEGDDDVDGGYVIRNSKSLIYKCWRIIFYTPVRETILNNWRIKFSMAGI
jgi:hypothetical protein